MCNFFSALALPNGDIFWHAMTDSHSDLIRLLKMRDDKIGKFAKLELVPPVDGWDDASKWKFTVDEETKPEWLEEIIGSTEKKMRSIAKGMIIKTGEIDLILDGCWIVCGDAHIREVRSVRIIRMLGSSTVKSMWGSSTAPKKPDKDKRCKQ